MCERFSLKADARDLTERYQIDRVLVYAANRHEIGPMQEIAAVIVREGERQLDQFRWGLLPFWAKGSQLADQSIIFGSRGLDRLVRKQRCVIPSDALYVWERRSRRRMTGLMRIALPEREVFAMPGLYEEWRSASGEMVRCCTIITTVSIPDVLPYREQMPVLLPSHSADAWLDPSLTDKQELTYVLEKNENKRLRMYAVRSFEDYAEEDGEELTSNPVAAW
nr:SOS response-associated peptidase family protein [Paenibacillus turpanensis]